MSNGQAAVMLRHLGKLVSPAGYQQASDHELLGHFVAHRDEAAFAALVRRHGPMVLHVCQRVLNHRQDAEDACQATFLVLARKATSPRWQDSIANWLYQVAHHLALKARAAAARRAVHEAKAQPRSAADPLADITLRELQAVLDEELARLPAKYRAPVSLCCLEGTARDEAAQQLGWALQTVKSRLERGRELLRARLARRGLTLSAVLAGTTLTQGPARALPAGFVNSTIQAAARLAAGKAAAGVVSAEVGALIEAMRRTVFLTKVKIVAALLLAVNVAAAGAGLLIVREVAAQPTKARQETPRLPAAVAKERPPAQGEAGSPATEPPLDERGDSVTLTGRVLDPDGRPFAGAEVSVWYYDDYLTGWHPRAVQPPRPRVLGKSGPDGRFRFTFAKSEIDDTRLNTMERPWLLVQIVAAAQGFGPGWKSAYNLEKEDLTLRLARDDIPIKGRVLDFQGRPAARAAVRLAHLMAGQDYLWQNAWMGLQENLTTDSDGRFVLTGIGRDRAVTLHINGPGIAHQLVSVATSATVNGRQVDGATLEVVAGPTKPVEGTIRAQDTGKPLAGVVVYGGEEAHRRGVRAVTDGQGRYRLVGMAKAGSYELSVYPLAGQSYLAKVKTVADTEGLRPLQADFDLRRGVMVRFRFADKQTHKTVRRSVQYTPLLHNPYYSEAVYDVGVFPSREFMRIRSPDKNGYFTFVAYPGPCVIFAFGGGHSRTPYLLARLSPADKERSKGDPIMGFVDLSEGYRIIDTDQTDKPLTFEIELDPGRTLTGVVRGPDSRPVAGATAYGLDYYGSRQPGGERVLKTEAFTAGGITAQEPRTLPFVHKGRKLIGHVVVRGDEKGPLSVRLQPWRTLTGRLVGVGGKSLPKVHVKAWHGMRAPGIWPPDASGGEVATDRDGRFRLEYLDPSLRRELVLSDGLSGGDRLKNLTVRPGEVKDLGNIPVRVAPTKQAK
jgi:RNA polymerase sigma factor (sigma-70 family)